jgi:hypothetical protein
MKSLRSVPLIDNGRYRVGRGSPFRKILNAKNEKPEKSF